MLWLEYCKKPFSILKAIHINLILSNIYPIKHHRSVVNKRVPILRAVFLYGYDSLENVTLVIRPVGSCQAQTLTPILNIRQVFH